MFSAENRGEKDKPYSEQPEKTKKMPYPPVQNQEPDLINQANKTYPERLMLNKVASSVIHSIFSGINSSRNLEANIAIKEDIFRNTRIRVERVSRGKVGIRILTNDREAIQFFRECSEIIKAGLLIRGIGVEEFAING